MGTGDVSEQPLRIGCLGAARIAPAAVINPARSVTGVEVTAVAARDHDRARAFAAKHGVAKTHGSYDALLADPDIDAIYNPLPNGLHAEWTLKAIEAGKHVLCEKPFTANAVEAQMVVDAAAKSGLTVMEAFHWRYHPLAARMLEIVRDDLGPLQRVSAAFCFPLVRFSDIRWELDLAGGALMDAGCYAVHMARTLAGEEPEITRASALELRPGVDRRMDAELRFPSGTAGQVTASMLSRTLLRISLRAEGEAGTMRVVNPLAPHMFHRLSVKTGGRTRREHVGGTSTYWYQLCAFDAAVRSGKPPITSLDDSVANMRVIDAIYRAAGMEPRRGIVA